MCLEDNVELCPIDGAPLVSAFQGDLIIDGKYRVEHRLGRGGMGVVYRVQHIGLQRHFALKVVNLPQLGRQYFLEHFRMEARALGRLKHPHIVDVTDYGVDKRGNGLPYLVMEYLEGRTLTELYRSEGALSPERALPIFDAIARAIDYAHDQGVLHRDLKPANVLIVRGDKAAETTKILDFGLARLLAGGTESQSRIDSSESKDDSVSAALAPPGEESFGNTMVALKEGLTLTLPPTAGPAGDDPREFVEGTLAYLAPEVFRGARAAPSADIYAFGVLIYETLVGKLPFSGSSLELLWRHLKTSPPVPSQVQPTLPPELDPPILAALAKEPERRPARAKGLVVALRNASLVALKRKWQAREIPRRLYMAAILALACTLMSWPLGLLGFVEELERRTTDARFATHPQRLADSRLLIVAVDEPSIGADPTPLADRANQFGSTLERVFAAGARGIAIDFILPEQWARSEVFSRFLLAHADNVTLAVLSSPSGEMLGTQCVSPLTGAALGPVRFAQLFGFANLAEDPDGVTRRAQVFLRDADGKLRDSWAGHASRSLTTTTSLAAQLPDPEKPFWIDYSADWRRLPKISWKDLAAQLDRNASVFRGRLVLVGGDLIGSGDDYHRIPARNGPYDAVSGLALQSLIVNTIVEGLPVQRGRSVLVLLILAIGCAAIIPAALCLSRLKAPLVVAFVFCALYAGAAVVFFRFWELLLPLAGPLLTAVLALGLGLVLRFYLSPFPLVRVEEA
jgi:serine/threonine protein kinase